MLQISKTDLVGVMETLCKRRGRVIVALAGPPGSGKSTLARELAQKLAVRAEVLPMDGFHLSTAVLEQMGLAHRKGAPETFDAAGFADLLTRVRQGHRVSYPTFDRGRDQTVANGGSIAEETGVVLAEGNYLLLDSPPWKELTGVFDLTVRLDVPMDELEARLMQRWRHHGLTIDEAFGRVHGNDLPNAMLVQENSIAPDYIIAKQ